MSTSSRSAGVVSQRLQRVDGAAVAGVRDGFCPYRAGPIRSASSRCATKRAVASSKTSARLIFLLKAKSASR